MLDNYLKRRVAFWDNLNFSLREIIEKIEINSANRPFKEDNPEITAILTELKNAEEIAMRKFHSVFGEQIKALFEDEGGNSL